jgi:hypothetical protein
MIPQITGMEGTMAGWTPYGSYTGPAVAGFNPTQEAGFSGVTGAATGGGSAVGDANANLKSTLDGTYLSAGNPYFGAMAQRIANSVLPQLSSQWSQAGRFAGNEEAPRAISTGLSDAVGQLAYQSYNQERQNQLTAGQMAPGLDQAQYIDPSMLLGIGGQQQQLTQQQINDAIYRATYLQNQPEAAIQATTGQLEGLGGMGSTGQSTTTVSPSMLQMLMGGGMAMGGMFGQKGAFPNFFSGLGSMMPFSLGF